MEKSQVDWLREHMRDHIANNSAVDSAEDILSLKRPPNSETKPGAAALDLVYQAAELIREVDNYAAERQARAETLAKQAIEKLEIADARVRSAESVRLAAEAEIKELRDRLQEVEKVMEQTASRMAATEAQLSAAEQRAREPLNCEQTKSKMHSSSSRRRFALESWRKYRATPGE